MKQAVHARDLKSGDHIRLNDRVWQVSGQFFEPPDSVDLDLFCADGTVNLHVGAGDLFELATRARSVFTTTTQPNDRRAT